MKVNKKGIVASGILIASMVLSGLVTFGVKSNADEETLAMVKAELQEQIDEKSKELEDKDKQLENLNNKIVEQSTTIDQLNKSIETLNQGLNNTNAALDSAKETQKQDKAEVVTHSDTEDEKLQKQIDEQKSNYESTHKVNPPVEAPREDPVYKK